jgi:hemerythrin
MAFKWEKHLSIDNDEVDSQHKQLFEKTNALLESMHKGKGKDVISETLKFLTDYIKFHFESEENLMTTNGYPDFASHRQEHNSFTLKIAYFKKKLEAEGISSTLVLETENFLVNWLLHHITKVDKELGIFLSDKKKTEN